MTAAPPVSQTVTLSADLSIDRLAGIIGPLDLDTLRAGYRSGARKPTAVIAAIYDAIAARGQDGVWIALNPREAALARAAELERGGGADMLPLWGVPFAVKDNIDVAGLPTTAACPAFAYTPTASATAVQKLLAAGAILIGKTNLDQFATGLVGVRSPYGVARNPFDPAYIPGGSSSGSAVAVSSGLVSFAFGTDTAGSGRVPAGFNNIVGLKPSIGLISGTGMVPACRSIDCISVFALTVPDSMAVLEVASGFDASDGYSRAAPAGWRSIVPARPSSFRFGLPRAAQRKFFGNAEAEKLFDAAIDRLQALGGIPVEFDYAPFAEAAAFLYQPAGTAERTAAVAAFMADHAADMHPVTRAIIEKGQQASGADVHTMHYRLQALRQQTAKLWDDLDCMVVPTSGTIYRIDEVEADPVTLNSNLGTYTNFVNYFDLAALAVPNGFQPNGLPAGITLIAPTFHEPVLAAIGHAFHRQGNHMLGATGFAQPAGPAAEAALSYPWITVAVFGAHMSGEPLNPQLLALGGRLIGPCRTAPDYRLYRLKEKNMLRPGLVRIGPGAGVSIGAELWALPPAGFGVMTAAIPGPLGIGSVTLDDGRSVKGFLCEAVAVGDAEDISAYGDWRAYRRTLAA
jgi:allophanate hydrolase